MKLLFCGFLEEKETNIFGPEISTLYAERYYALEHSIYSQNDVLTSSAAGVAPLAGQVFLRILQPPQEKSAGP
jgi:hypothetical protein